MTLAVLSVAFPFAPVRPETAGGAEQVLATLDRGLTRAGHMSIMAACARSTGSGFVVETAVETEAIDDAARARGWARHRRTIMRALSRWTVDLIHMHGVDFHAYLPPPGPPVLVTLHLPVAWYSPAAFARERPDVYFNCVSENQHQSCPRLATLMPFIENGVPLDFYFAQSGVKKDGFALCLGRICPEKGFHIALDAARRAGVGLVIGGSVFGYEEHERYFRGEIAPSLDGRKYRYVGPVGPRKKRELLRAARCLLVPSLVHETSSLVAMEAMACETPVIAFPSGALPSIVEHQTTGFLVKDAAEMADAIGRSARIDPGRCRSVAKARFSADRMVRQYLRAYRKILEGGSACTSR